MPDEITFTDRKKEEEVTPISQDVAVAVDQTPQKRLQGFIVGIGTVFLLTLSPWFQPYVFSFLPFFALFLFCFSIFVFATRTRPHSWFVRGLAKGILFGLILAPLVFFGACLFALSRPGAL